MSKALKYIIGIAIVIFIFKQCYQSTVLQSTTSPTYTTDESELRLAEQTIMGYEEVTDAAINKQGNRMSLAIVVKKSTSIQRSKELGENFVRLTMQFVSEENNPSKELGDSIYDYLIGVYHADNKKVVSGAKVTFSKHITW